MRPERLQSDTARADVGIALAEPERPHDQDLYVARSLHSVRATATLCIDLAQIEGVPLVTVDRALDDYDVETIRADRGAHGDVDV